MINAASTNEPNDHCKLSFFQVLTMERLRAEMEEKGMYLPPQKEKGQHFDSNCITPGTPFMDRLSNCLQYYIHDRLNNDPGWKNIKASFIFGRFFSVDLWQLPYASTKS